MTWTDLHHYFDWCALQQSWWTAAVDANPKTRAVNAKLTKWHAENPDQKKTNVVKLRIARGLRR